MTRKRKPRSSTGASRSSPTPQSIVTLDRQVDIGVPVVLWTHRSGFKCPNKRGRTACSQHDPALNDQPTRPESLYAIADPAKAYEELSATVYQLVLHYDVCYSSFHCHQLLKDSGFKGSHFYLDLDGTVYQTCDLYWKTNTAPADDRRGNERSVHIEISNLANEALKSDSILYRVDRDQYRLHRGRWKLDLPDAYAKRLRTPGFTPYSARSHGDRGYFSRIINGDRIRMWDFTREQYDSLVRLCVGIHRLLPRIKLQVPVDGKTGRTPLDRIANYSRFEGILGHGHVQAGTTEGVTRKHDPGPAFQWGWLRRALAREQRQGQGTGE